MSANIIYTDRFLRQRPAEGAAPDRRCYPTYREYCIALLQYETGMPAALARAVMDRDAPPPSDRDGQYLLDLDGPDRDDRHVVVELGRAAS